MYPPSLTPLSHYFPLRPGLDTQVTLPRDLSKAEADRLCAWIQTLALSEPWPPPPAAGEGTR